MLTCVSFEGGQRGVAEELYPMQSNTRGKTMEHVLCRFYHILGARKSLLKTLKRFEITFGIVSAFNR
jgi:hypothetical protein